MKDFSKAFQALTGFSPLPWQARLFEELAGGRLPSALDLPTGLGKTSVIPIWLAARAAKAQVPRRLIYVVDRRAVVDQATAVAEGIARRLADEAGANETIRELRDGLGLKKEAPLAVSTLRGQLADNRQWLEDPVAPAIIVGTVDMIGSRLLFSGYGVRPGMRSVHAALLGADALLVLDEAHLVPPFEHLLRAVAGWPRRPEIPAFRLLTLSATGRTEGDAPFRLSAEDLEDPRTSARLRASKRLKVEDAGGDLVEALAQRAIEHAGDSARVIVFCDSRKIAQKVAERLRSLARTKHGRDTPEPVLLVGGRRVWERSRLEQDPVFRRFVPQSKSSEQGAAEQSATGPAFLVATSAGEVGVDLDADHLVMDLVPWERMVQRLGRVNRRAEPGEALVDVLVATPDKEAESGKDKKLEDLQRWRAPFESAVWSRDADGRRDASPASLLRLRENPDFRRLTSVASTPEPLHPNLSGPLLDAWAMTSLDEHPGRPNVTPWLRGWVEEELQTRLIWRRYLPVRADDLDEARLPKAVIDDLKAFFASASPHLSEALDVPTYQAAEAIRKRALAWTKSKPGSDEQGQSEPSPLVVVLDGRDDVETAWRVEQVSSMDGKELVRLVAGRTVVLDARLGGLDEDGLLDEKRDEPPLTLDAPSESSEEWTQRAGFRVRRIERDEDSDSDDKDWPVEYRFVFEPEGEGGDELVVEVLRIRDATRGDPAIARKEQGLSEHLDWTAQAARRIAKALALPKDFEEALVAAAAVHDAGKARELWQNAMRAPSTDRPYAKTRGGGNYRALMIDGLLYRHEFGSIADAERNPAISALPEASRELALHLVAAHHGYARPVIAPLDPDVPPSLAVERARQVALRFQRLHRLWGPWGLAWWETLLRAADWEASRAANEPNGEGK